MDYQQYMKSREWRNMRHAKMMTSGFVCEKCGRDDGSLDVHHKTYERLGHERLDDLVVLCRYCHMVEHGEIIHPAGGGNPDEPF